MSKTEHLPDPDPDPVPVDGELPREIIKYMLDPMGDLDEAVQGILDHLLVNEKHRASLYLIAIVRKRLCRLMSVFERMDSVSESLADDLDRKNLGPQAKLEFLKLLQGEADRVSKFIREVAAKESMSLILSEVAEGGQAGPRHTRKAELKFPESFEELSPERRERVRQAVELMKAQLLGPKDDDGSG